MRILRGTNFLGYPKGGRRGESPAFTLLELLVGVAILTILVVILSGVFGGVSKTWQLGQSSNERLQNIRAITDFISGELRSALLPVNRTDKANLQFIVNPGSISSSFRNGDAVFWQAPVSAVQTYGDVAAVGYFVRWDESRASNPRPNLCRFYTSQTTSPANFLIYSQNGGSVQWLTDAILNAVAPADRANAYEGLIAENVVAIFAQCLDAKGRPIEKSYAESSFSNGGFDSRLGYTDLEGNKSADFTLSGAKQPLCVLPPMVKLSFVLLDSKSAAGITPAQKAILTGLAASLSQRSPKGDANEFTATALADPALKGVSEGLRAHQMEVNLLNAR